MKLRQLLLMIWSGRLRLLLCALACLAGALAFSLREPNTYEARARVMLEVVQADPVTGVVIGNKQVDAYVDTQRLLAMSVRTAERAVDKLGWVNNQAVIDSWQAQTGGVGDIREWAAGRLAATVGAVPLEGGGTMEIIYRAADPQGAESIVRIMREAYIETALALQTEAATRRANDYAALARQARAALTKAQDNLVKLQRDTKTVLGPTGTDIDNSGLARMETTTINTELAASRDVIRAMPVTGDSDSVPIQRKLVDVEQQLANAEGSMGTDNPTYRALLNQRAELTGQLTRAQAASRAKQGVAASAARKMAGDTQAAYLNERARVLGRGDDDVRLAEALRMVQLRRTELNRITANEALARQSANRTESGLVVMGDVITNPKPVAPNVPITALLATLFGLGLGLASVVIDGLARREVLGLDDLAEASGVPVLARVPSERPKWFARWFARWRPRRHAAA